MQVEAVSQEDGGTRSGIPYKEGWKGVEAKRPLKDLVS